MSAHVVPALLPLAKISPPGSVSSLPTGPAQGHLINLTELACADGAVQVPAMGPVSLRVMPAVEAQTLATRPCRMGFVVPH